MDKRPFTCCFTGHRNLPAGQEEKIWRRVHTYLEPLLEEGVRQETAWGHYVIGDAIPGLTRQMVTDYIRYLGNLRWTSLGFGTLYEGYEAEPANMAWVLEGAMGETQVGGHARLYFIFNNSRFYNR